MVLMSAWNSLNTSIHAVLKHVMESLHMKESNIDIIRLTSNRPNLTLGVIRMIGSPNNLANLKFVVPDELDSSSTVDDIMTGVVFVDNKTLACQIAKYLNSLLPEHLRKLEPFRHMHSSMSKEYNMQTFHEFTTPTGPVKGLVAKDCASHVHTGATMDASRRGAVQYKSLALSLALSEAKLKF